MPREKVSPWILRVWGLTELHLVLLLLPALVHPIPCGPEILTQVRIGEVSGYIGFSQTYEDGFTEARFCSIINVGYEGDIIIGCDDGYINATVEGCAPARCPPYLSLAVAMGDVITSVTPLETILSGGSEQRLCREVNPLYRKGFTLFCNYGALSVDLRACVPQHDAMPTPPWEPRAKQAAVTMGDGALLLMGGLGERGPLRDVWQWTPSIVWEVPPLPPHRESLGDWEQPWAVSVPPWSARYGAVAVWQERESGEQVMMLGGNDNRNRNDVWRWLRRASVVDIALEDSDAAGSQPQDCSVLSGDILHCDARVGVSGRRWYMSEFLRPSTEVHVKIRHYSRNHPASAAVIGLQVGSCRQVFQVIDEYWSTQGCTGDDPPWAQTVVPTDLGPSGDPDSGGWHTVRLVIDKAQQTVQLTVDGRTMPAVFLPQSETTTLTAEEACRRQEQNALGLIEDVSNRTDCGEVSEAAMQLYTIELAAWPSSVLEATALAVTAPSGYWQKLAEEAPWQPRSTHTAVSLPDGDILLMGGLGDDSLLNDVWRWTNQSCPLLPETKQEVAAEYKLQCAYACRSSPIYGQWARLPDAPWEPRQEQAAVWTAVGLLVLGGRSATGFKNDIWRWTSSGDLCSIEWEGHWEELTAAAAWQPRVGHAVVGFAPSGGEYAETLLLFGGFGGYEESEHVTEIPVGSPIQMRNDIWCGNVNLSGFKEWSELAPNAPFSARTQTSMVVAPTVGTFSMFFFGGYDKNARFTSDFWRWAGENATSACKAEADMLHEMNV